MVRVGIPRALLYYQYYPMWKTFFEHLGAEVVITPETTKLVVTSGSSRMVAETCLPAKVFCGHVLSLVGQCDYVFVPAIRSIEENAYNCAKFLGLPDLVKAVVPECPPILDVDIDISKGKRALYLAIYALGRRFTWNPLKIKEACDAAWETHLAYQALMREDGLTSPQAINRLRGEGGEERKGEEHDLNIAVIGHPYVIYDEYINHRLIKRLEALGVEVFTPEMVAEEDLDRSVAQLVGRSYWTYEDEVTGAGGYYLESGVDGVIGVIPFGCGPDSLMTEVLRRHARKDTGMPYMSLTIDEHTAEAGLVTRLEAFVDMIRRGKRKAPCA